MGDTIISIQGVSLWDISRQEQREILKKVATHARTHARTHADNALSHVRATARPRWGGGGGAADNPECRAGGGVPLAGHFPNSLPNAIESVVQKNYNRNETEEHVICVLRLLFFSFGVGCATVACFAGIDQPTI